MDTTVQTSSGEAATGTVTFLFTDIEGSTRLWEAHPDVMGELVERHDRLIHEIVDGHGGRVFKTIGDACCATFTSAPSALEAGMAIQSKIGGLSVGGVGPLKVRLSIHTGEAQVRDGDYFGSALSRVARILSIGSGGQILLSLSASELVRESLEDGVELLDLGQHRLRDLQRPERIFQVCHPGLPRDFPPLRSLSSLPNNLPQQASSFVGREREIEDVKGHLAEARVLTLLGSGGCGKTRLSLQVAADQLSQFVDGVWLLELAPISDPELVSQTACSAVGIREVAGQSPADSLVEHLREKQALLIFDNCEHVLDAAAQLSERLIRECPGVRVLATSREPLKIGGEVSYRVPSLGVPEGADRLGLRQTMQYDSVRLLLERAKAVKPVFELSDRTAPIAAEICRRLDGIPLAIELAAARVQSMPIEQIAARLDDRFRLLTGGSRTALPRQQTLRALIEWSYDLLEARERQLLLRLGVFSGGWTLDAASSVCSGAGDLLPDAMDVVDSLESLVQKSLVAFDDSKGDEGRYWMLESVRQFARDKGAEAEADDSAGLELRHAQFYAAFAETAAPFLTGSEQRQWLAKLDLEHANLRAAIDHLGSRQETLALGLRLVGKLARFWMIRGHVREGGSCVAALVDAANGIDDPAVLAAKASALMAKGSLHWMKGEIPDSREAFEAALKIQDRLGNDEARAAIFAHLSVVAIAEMNYDLAQDWITRSLGLNQKLGIKHGIASSLGALGTVLEKKGELELAAGRYRESLAIWEEEGNRHAMAVFQNNIGSIFRKQGDLEAALKFARDALSLRHEIGDRQGMIWSLEAFAKLALVRGDPVRAARLLAAASAQRSAAGIPLPAIDKPEWEQADSDARAALGDDDHAKETQAGSALDLESAVELALGLQ